MIYFDNAATTYPKPHTVPDAVVRCMVTCGGNPGRSGHRLSMLAGEQVYACREAVGGHFGASPEQVVFAANATQALNMAIKGLARRGGHILISDLEHNAVYRTVAALGSEGVSFGIFPTGEGDFETIRAGLIRRIRPNTSLIVCTHASNLCSTRLPIAQIGRFLAERGIRFVVDASQSAGSADLKMDDIFADALCAPGHKGLYGPQGCGFAVFSKRYLGEGGRMLRTLIQGGSGVDSAAVRMPDFLPERMEAGTIPAPLLAGLTAGIRAVERVGIETIRAHEIALFERMRERLSERKRIRMYRPNHAGSVLLFSVDGMGSEEVAALLDDEGICVRAGLHCAPLAHRTLCTPKDGAVRVSFSMYNTEEEVDRCCELLERMEAAR